MLIGNSRFMRAFLLAEIFSNVLKAIAYSFIGEEEKALASAFMVTGWFILHRKFFYKKGDNK